MNFNIKYYTTIGVSYFILSSIITSPGFANSFNHFEKGTIASRDSASQAMEDKIEKLFAKENPVEKADLKELFLDAKLNKELTGLECGDVTYFLQNNGIDTQIREMALEDLKNNSKKEFSAECNVDKILKSENIQVLKKIPVDQIENKSDSFSGEIQQAISCINGNSNKNDKDKNKILKLYLQALHQAENSVWKNLATNLKLAVQKSIEIQKQIKIQKPEVDLSSQQTVVEDYQTIRANIHNVQLCFADVKDGDETKSYLINIKKESGNEKLDYSDVGGAIIDDVQTVKGGGK